LGLSFFFSGIDLGSGLHVYFDMHPNLLG